MQTQNAVTICVQLISYLTCNNIKLVFTRKASGQVMGTCCRDDNLIVHILKHCVRQEVDKSSKLHESHTLTTSTNLFIQSVSVVLLLFCRAQPSDTSSEEVSVYCCFKDNADVVLDYRNENRLKLKQKTNTVGLI